MLFPPKLSSGHHIVTTGDGLAAMVRECSQQSTIAFDFETAGLRWWNGQLPIGFAVGYLSERGQPRAWYVPFDHKTLDPQAEASAAKRAFEDVLEAATELVAQNAKFDLNMARALGWRIPDWTTIHDTQIQTILIDETKPRGLERRVMALGCSPYGDANAMKDAVSKWIRARMRTLRMSWTGYLDSYGHSEVPVDLEGEYACRDIGHTLALDRAQRMKALGYGMPYAAERQSLYANEMWLVRALADMEWHGQRVDTAYLARTRLTIDNELDRLGTELQRHFGGDRAWNNDNTVRELVYGELKMTAERFTKGGKPSVDKAALSDFLPAHPGMEPLLEWRAYYKVRSTYTDSLAEKADSRGYVHPSFNQGGAASGRLSSSGPNFQNIPSRHPTLSKMVRRAFTVDAGRVRIYCDYSQIELRMLAWITGNRTLTAAYQSDAYDRLCWDADTYDGYRERRQSEEAADIHGLVARTVFGADPDAPDWKRKRGASKIINFGVPYGGGPNLLISNPELRLDARTAKRWYDAYHAANPEIGQTKRRLLQKMRAGDLSFVNWAGRVRHGYRLEWADEALRAEEERSMFACLVQGSAAELTRYSIVRLWMLEKTGKLPGISTSTVHDEIQVDCDAPDVREVSLIVQREMEAFTGLFGPIPVIADIETTYTSWADKKDYQP